MVGQSDRADDVDEVSINTWVVESEIKRSIVTLHSIEDSILGSRRGSDSDCLGLAERSEVFVVADQELGLVSRVSVDSRVASCQRCNGESILEQTEIWLDGECWVRVRLLNIRQGVVLVGEYRFCDGSRRITRIDQGQDELGDLCHSGC